MIWFLTGFVPGAYLGYGLGHTIAWYRKLPPLEKKELTQDKLSFYIGMGLLTLTWAIPSKRFFGDD
jgi:hypothetical protein